MKKSLKDRLCEYTSADIVNIRDVDLEAFNWFGFGSNVEVVYNKSNDTYTFTGNFGRNIKSAVLRYMNDGKIKNLFRKFSSSEIIIDSLFLLEFMVLINKILENNNIYYGVNKKSLNNLKNVIINDTPYGMYEKYKDSQSADMIPAESRVLNMSRIGKTMKVSPMPFQQVLFDRYEVFISGLGYTGMLVDASTGTGKTPMSLMWAEALGAEVVVIVAINNTMDTTWKVRLTDPKETYYKEVVAEKDVYTTKDLYGNIKYNSERYIILNYESLGRTEELAKAIRNKKIALIIDEAHNFTSMSAGRRTNLINFNKTANIVHCLALSGTPIKSSSLELMIYMELILPGFNSVAAARYRTIYGSPNAFFKEILPIRYGDLSVKIRKESLNLKDIEYLDVDVTLSSGSNYTLKKIKDDMLKYFNARLPELISKQPKAREDFDRCVDIIRSKKVASSLDIDKYLDNHMRIIKADGNLFIIPESLKIVNEFENKVILPNLDKVNKELFKEATVILKYPKLKVSGEVLGKVVLRARIDCHRDIARVFDYSTVMNGTLAKTIIMSGYVEVCETALEATRKLGYKPVGIYGDLTKQQDASITAFKNNPEVDPLIGTYKSISTGHHLVVADTIIAMDLPFRTYLFDQAVARAWRLGQENVVKVIYPKLNTGAEYNINSRNIDILKWAKEAVEEITGDKVYGLDFDKSNSLGAVSEMDIESLDETILYGDSIYYNDSVLTYNKEDEMSNLKNRLAHYANMDIESDATALPSEGTTGTYVAVKVINCNALYEFFKSQGIDVVPADELHSTIAYSRVQFDREPVSGDILVAASELAPKLSKLGDEGAVVLKYSNDEIKRRFDSCIEAGATYDYDEYQPHITITYNGTDLDLDAIKVPDFNITLGDEYVEELDLDWKKKLEEKIDNEGGSDLESITDMNSLKKFDGMDTAIMLAAPLFVIGTISLVGAIDSWWGSKKKQKIIEESKKYNLVGSKLAINLYTNLGELFKSISRLNPDEINSLTRFFNDAIRHSNDERIVIPFDYNNATKSGEWFWKNDIDKVRVFNDSLIPLDGNNYETLIPIFSILNAGKTTIKKDLWKLVDYVDELIKAKSKDSRRTLLENIIVDPLNSGKIINSIGDVIDEAKDDGKTLKALMDFSASLKVVINYIDVNLKIIKKDASDLESFDALDAPNYEDVQLKSIADVNSFDGDIEMPIVTDSGEINTASRVANVADLESFDTFKGWVAGAMNKANKVMIKLSGLFKSNDSEKTYNLVLKEFSSSSTLGNYANVKIGVPPGLNGWLSDISGFVKDNSTQIDVLNVELDKAIEIISTFINSEDYRSSFALDTVYIKRVQEANSKLHKMSSQVLTNSRQDVREVGMLLKSTNDFKVIVEDLRVANKILTLSKLEEVREKLVTIDSFIKVLTSNNTFSKVKIRELSQIIDSLNSYVNGVATIVFLKNTLDILVVDIKSVMK